MDGLFQRRNNGSTSLPVEVDNLLSDDGEI